MLKNKILVCGTSWRSNESSVTEVTTDEETVERALEIHDRVLTVDIMLIRQYE